MVIVAMSADLECHRAHTPQENLTINAISVTDNVAWGLTPNTRFNALTGDLVSSGVRGGPDP